MKYLLLTISLATTALLANAQNEITIRLDTKLMGNFGCALGGGDGNPAPVNTVYMHSGACSENRGSNPSETALDYCAGQIQPFDADVWQHVVGNWGEFPADDGVGEMTHIGDGVYDFSFVPETYYSDASIVSTEANSSGSTVSSPLVPGNPIHVIGMVFRNEDGTQSGRDEDFCNDIFIINYGSDNVRIVNSDFLDQDFVQLLTETSIRDHSSVSSFSVGPNPTDGITQFNIGLNNPMEDVLFDVTSMLGQQIHTEMLSLNAGQSKIEWDASNIPSGVYTATLSSTDGVIAQERIMVK